MSNTATAHPDGTGTLQLDGRREDVATSSLDEARAELLRRVIAHARTTGIDVSVTAQDPDSEHQLVVSPDGTVRPASHTLDQTGRSDRPGRSDHHDRSGQDDQPAARSVAEPATSSISDTARGHDARSFLTVHEDTRTPDTGWRGFLARLGITVKPSTVEKTHRADIRAVSSHWPGPRTIAVVNGKGGAGKTPTTVLLAALFARHGGSGVLAWDNNETRGTLGWRTEQGPHHAHVLDLLPSAAELMQPTARSADLAGYVHHQLDDKYDVLRSNPLLLPHQQRLTADDFHAVHQVASKYFRLLLIDSGNDETAPHWLAMIDQADQLVVPTTTRPDHAEAGRLLLDALRDRDDHSAHLADHAVVIVSQADREEAAATSIAARFNGLARTAVTIPYDRAMRTPWLRYDNLNTHTQSAYLTAAAAAAEGL